MTFYQRAYDRAARAQDAGRPGPSPAIQAQRAVQDTLLGERHRQWDLAAQDNTPKSHRFHFAVLGEASKSAQERYREHYGKINWRE